MADRKPTTEEEQAAADTRSAPKLGTHPDEPTQPEPEILADRSNPPKEETPRLLESSLQPKKNPNVGKIIALICIAFIALLSGFATALQIAGVTSVLVAHSLIVATWAGFMLSIGVADYYLPLQRKQKLRIIVVVGLVSLLPAVVFDLLIIRKTAEPDRGTYSPTQTPTPAQTATPTPADHSSILPTIQPSPSETPRPLPSPLIPETVERSPSPTASATPAPRISPTHSVFLGADPQVGLIECYIKGEDDRGIHGATVTAHNDKTNRDYVGTTNSAGEARIQVAVGSYTVTVKAQGYAMQTGATTVSGYEKGFIEMVLVRQ